MVMGSGKEVVETSGKNFKSSVFQKCLFCEMNPIAPELYSWPEKKKKVVW